MKRTVNFYLVQNYERLVSRGVFKLKWLVYLFYGVLVAELSVGAKVVLVLDFETKGLIQMKGRMLDSCNFKDSVRVVSLAK